MSSSSRYVIAEADVEGRREPGDTAETRVTISSENGSGRLEQRVIRFAAGRARPRRSEGRHELLYVVSGGGRLILEGEPHELEPEAGAFVAAGETYEIENPGPEELVLVSATAPAEHATGPNRRVVVRYGEQPELRADEYRTFRYLVNEDAGCLDLTQFVGIVEPSRAPDHSHDYDEVGYVIEGEGVAHIDGAETRLAAGSCFHLPPEKMHCIENVGDRPMRILGVFHPSGSPAARAYATNQ